MKLQMTWTAKLPHHVLFATQHTGLHNQIVHNGISSLGNKCVVPENIHTPPTEDSLICTPPPRIFHSKGVLDDPPPPRNFLNFYTGTSSCQSGFGILKKTECEY